MDSDSGKATLPVSVLSPFSVADHLNGTNLLIKEQMYSFKKVLSLEGFGFQGKQTESQEGFPLVEIVEKHEYIYPQTFR